MTLLLHLLHILHILYRQHLLQKSINVLHYTVLKIAYIPIILAALVLAALVIPTYVIQQKQIHRLIEISAHSVFQTAIAAEQDIFLESGLHNNLPPLPSYLNKIFGHTYHFSLLKNDWFSHDEVDFWQETDQNSLTAYIPSRNKRTMLIPLPDNTAPNWQHFSFTLDFMHIKGADLNILFNYHDPANWYEIHLKYGIYQIVRVQDGVVRFQAFGTAPVQKEVWHTIHLNLIEDEIFVYLDQKLVGIHADWTANTEQRGSIGLRATTGAIYPTQVSFRNVAITEIISSDESDLLLPFDRNVYLQTNPLWAQELYNTANSWSNTPTIERWGCLLTSIALVMNYHSITHFPKASLYDSKTSLTPASLNTWLISQPDGYIGKGLINWIAVTRLSRLIHEQYGTPNLEYAILHGNTQFQETEYQFPVIYQLDGHFVVGFGNNSIHDPLDADLTSLESHPRMVESGVLSTRLLTPSYTDLSYFVFVHDPETTITVINTITDTRTSLTPTKDWIIPINQSTSPHTQYVSVYPKPKTGHYQISVHNAYPQHTTLEVLTYDTQANPQTASWAGWLTPLTQNLFDITFDVDNNSLSFITPSTQTFDAFIAQFIDELALIKNSIGLSTESNSVNWNNTPYQSQESLLKSDETKKLFTTLITIMMHIQKTSITQNDVVTINNLIKQLSECLSVDVIEYLTERLQELELYVEHASHAVSEYNPYNFITHKPSLLGTIKV